MITLLYVSYSVKFLFQLQYTTDPVNSSIGQILTSHLWTPKFGPKSAYEFLFFRGSLFSWFFCL